MSKRQIIFDQTVAPALKRRGERIATELHKPADAAYHVNAMDACDCTSCMITLAAIMTEYELTARPARAAFFA